MANITDALKAVANSKDMLVFLSKLNVDTMGCCVGGRRYVHVDNQGTLTLKDLTRKANEILNGENPRPKEDDHKHSADDHKHSAVDGSKVLNSRFIYRLITYLDKEGDKQLGQSNIIYRVVTFFCRLFGNFSLFSKSFKKENEIKELDRLPLDKNASCYGEVTDQPIQKEQDFVYNNLLYLSLETPSKEDLVVYSKLLSVYEDLSLKVLDSSIEKGDVRDKFEATSVVSLWLSQVAFSRGSGIDAHGKLDREVDYETSYRQLKSIMNKPNVSNLIRHRAYLEVVQLAKIGFKLAIDDLIKISPDLVDNAIILIMEILLNNGQRDVILGAYIELAKKGNHNAIYILLDRHLGHLVENFPELFDGAFVQHKSCDTRVVNVLYHMFINGKKDVAFKAYSKLNKDLFSAHHLPSKFISEFSESRYAAMMDD